MRAKAVDSNFLTRKSTLGKNSRILTHRAMILNQEIPTVSFSRNVMFTKKAGVEKKYEENFAEIIIKQYESENVDDNNFEQVGYAKVNLSQYINESL